MKLLILQIIFLLGLFINPKFGLSQSVVGNFRATSAEKINGYFYVFGIGEKYEIKVAKYNEKLELVREVTRPLKENVGTFFGIPYVGEFYQRNLFDIRIVYKSGIVAWLTFDLNLNELGLQEYDYSKEKNKVPSEPNIYNPIYSEGSYASNYGFQKTTSGFYINNYFYHFLTSSSSEFSNTSTDKYSYYYGEPVFRKLDKMDNTAPFYKEIKRVPLSKNEFLKGFDPKKYTITFINQKDSFLYFLASKKTLALEKDDIQLMKVDENTLSFEENIDLNLDSIYPELGTTLYAKTYFDSINQRIIQIGNYTGTPYTKKWWVSDVDYSNSSLQCKGYYICEFDLMGKVIRFKKLNFPNYDLKFTIKGDRFYEKFKAFCVEDKGIIFSKDGSIRLIGENSVLTYHHATNESLNKGVTWHKNQYYYSPVSVTFMNIGSDFEIIGSNTVVKEHLKKNTEIDIRNDLLEFSPNENVNNMTALFVETEVMRDFIDMGENQKGENTQKHLIYSTYYGMRYIKVGVFNKIFLYDGQNSVIFNKSNSKGKFEFRFYSNKG